MPLCLALIASGPQISASSCLPPEIPETVTALAFDSFDVIEGKSSLPPWHVRLGALALGLAASAQLRQLGKRDWTGEISSVPSALELLGVNRSGHRRCQPTRDDTGMASCRVRERPPLGSSA